MTSSILDDILRLEDKTIRGMKSYFDKVALNIFEPLYSLDDAYQTILFILCAYSEESPMLIYGQDPKAETIQICEKLDIPEFNHVRFHSLNDKDLKKCVVDYIFQFAGAEFKELQFLKLKLKGIEEILAEMLCVRVIKEKDAVDTTEFDAATHSRLINSSEIISKKIAKMEAEFKKRKKFKNIERFFSEIKNDKREESLNIENNLLVKRNINI